MTAHTVLTHKGKSYRFFLGDCVETLPAVDRADVIVTSPPYNIGAEYRTYKDNLPMLEYLQWTYRWLVQAAFALNPKGSLFLNVGVKPSEPWLDMDVANQARTIFALQNRIHWIKSIALAGTAVGHYKPINSKRFINDCHESIFHFTKFGNVELDRLAVGVPFKDASNQARWSSGAGVRCRGNTWFIPYETIQKRDKDRPHPATFPVALPGQCIKLHGVSRATEVLDPFCGIGSTAIACVNLGVNFTGIELDEEYLKEAVRRTMDAIARQKREENEVREIRGQNQQARAIRAASPINTEAA